MSETLSSIFRPTRNGGVSISTSSPTHVTEVEDDAYVSADADDNKSGELTPLSPIISPRAFNQKTNPTSIITIEGVVTSSTLPTIIQKSFTKRLIQILLTLTCLLGYGISLYVNGLSGRTLTPATGLVLLGSVRGITLLILSTILYITNSVPVGYQRYSNEPPATVRWQLLVPAFVAIYANSGFLPYAELIKGGQVSVLAPMCALYSLVPISIGLLVFKESRGILKLTGIALSLTSVLLLAFSGSGFAGTSATASEIGIKILLLFSVVALWGGGDAMAAYLGRSLSSFEIAISNSAGQFATAAIFGLIAIVSGESFSNDGGNISFILSSVAANILGIIAWMSFTKLGETEGASDFTPIVALYVFIPVLLSSIFLHESLIDSPLKLTGLILGGVASILLGLK